MSTTQCRRVYVAGAYSGPDVLTILANIRRGLRAGYLVNKAGFAAFVPWTDWLLHMAEWGPEEEALTLGDYYQMSMAWLEASEAVLVVPEGAEQSKGTQAELKRARELDLPIFQRDTVEESIERMKAFFQCRNVGTSEDSTNHLKQPNSCCCHCQQPVAETILEEAARLTSGPRQRDYDHPLPNHERIATLWNAYLRIRPATVETYHELSAEDVAWMMILLKAARDVYTPKRDNLVDVCGYARCLERMRARYGQKGYSDIKEDGQEKL